MEMTDETAGEGLGLTGAVSMALGGMIGGGIYAVLGVVVKVGGPLRGSPSSSPVSSRSVPATPTSS